MTTQNGATPNTACPSTGWIVKSAPGYYTRIKRSPLERWTAFPKLARVYRRKGWAQKVAHRLAGQVIPIERGKMTNKK